MDRLLGSPEMLRAGIKVRSQFLPHLERQSDVCNMECKIAVSLPRTYPWIEFGEIYLVSLPKTGGIRKPRDDLKAKLRKKI